MVLWAEVGADTGLVLTAISVVRATNVCQLPSHSVSRLGGAQQPDLLMLRVHSVVNMLRQFHCMSCLMALIGQSASSVDGLLPQWTDVAVQGRQLVLQPL
jgi:hypothetical protein